MATSKSLLNGKTVSSRYYRDFRGVDFASDHTEVSANRFAYLCNMYRDYHNGQGAGTETIPGFRKITANAYDATVDGNLRAVKPISDMKFFRLTDSDGNIHEYIAVLFGIGSKSIVILKADNPSLPGTIVYFATDPGSAPSTDFAEDHMICFEFRKSFYIIVNTESEGDVKISKIARLDYKTPTSTTRLDEIQVSVVATEFYGAGGNESNFVHIPSTYINIKPGIGGEVENPGIEYEQKNFLTRFFKNTFIADGDKTVYAMSEDITLVDVHHPGEMIVPTVYGMPFIVLNGSNVPFLGTGTVSWSSYPTVSTPSALAAKIGENGFAIGTVESGADISLAIGGTTETVTKTAIGYTETFTGTSTSRKILFVTRKFHSGEGMDVQEAYAFPMYCKKSASYANAVEFLVAPPEPQLMGFEEEYAGVEIIARGGEFFIDIDGGTKAGFDILSSCRLCTVYDNRVFLSGSPLAPNHVFWCGIPAGGDGIPDPTYFGALNYERDGIGQSPIKAMFPVADTLCVIKGDTITDGVVYYHTPTVTDQNLVPKIYPSTRGISGQGCVAMGGAINFRDDPVFITKDGISAIGQLSVRYERATEHRSSMIDNRLTAHDLSKAKLEVYDGYLLVVTDDGHIYMADSRQVYEDKTGIAQYEWYMLDYIGSYSGDEDALRFAKNFPSDEFKEEAEAALEDVIGVRPNLEIATEFYNEATYLVSDVTSEIANSIVDDVYEATIGEGTDDEFSFGCRKAMGIDGEYHYYYCEYAMQSNGLKEQVGGVFHPATVVKAIGDDLYFGTEDGLFKFNFDLRRDDGSFPNYYIDPEDDENNIDVYSRCGHAYVSGCATLMDNCGIPHMEKRTEAKSLVIKTRSEDESVAKIRVRTNRHSFDQLTRIGDGKIDFGRLDFSETAFTTTPRSLFAIRERERHWVEKQYFLYNDEYNKSFCLYYIVYQFTVQGRYKNK